MNRGALIYAHNNEQIDYTLISLCNALSIKANLGIPVCLVTDEWSIEYLRTQRGNEIVDRAFDKIILEPKPDAGKKRFRDTESTTHVLPWYNSTRSDAYELTPFEETLLIDSDYFVMDKTLGLAWGSVHDVMINRKVIPLDHGDVPSSERWLENSGIEMCWATCIYFRKSPLAEKLFDIVQHVRDQYPFYAMVYGFPTQLFRNDYAFSIAVHMMSGFTRCNDIPSLPSSYLFTSFDCDELMDIPAKNEMTFYMNNRREKWRFSLTKTKNINVHVLNKFSIIRMADKFLALYGDDHGE